jgi:hypothetical protein
MTEPTVEQKTEVVQNDINKQIREKLGLTPFGVAQPPLAGPAIGLEPPKKPDDLPKDSKEWLDKQGK